MRGEKQCYAFLQKKRCLIGELRFILESEPKIISDDVMTIKQNALQYMNRLLEDIDYF